MARIITKELALEIAKKLQAVKHTKKGRPHDLYRVFHRGQMVAQFGIRHGSEKDKGHDHIPGQIHVGPRDAKEFAICNLDLPWWVHLMQEKGVIPTDPPPEPEEQE